MIYAYARPQRGGIAVAWQSSGSLDSDAGFTLTFSRVVLGVSWDATLHYACVIGERLLETGAGLERYWVVLDEDANALAQPLFASLVSLKDRYYAALALAPDNPAAIVETLRRTDGLSRYTETDYRRAERRWPTFVDFDVTCGVRTLAVPDEPAMSRDLERWLTEPLYSPATAEPLLDNVGQTLTRIVLPSTFPTSRLRQALEQAHVVPSQALWFALTHLEQAPIAARTRSTEPVWEHRPGRGGY